MCCIISSLEKLSLHYSFHWCQISNSSWHSIINSKLFKSANVFKSSKGIWNDCMSSRFPQHHSTPLAFIIYPFELFPRYPLQEIITSNHFTFDISWMIVPKTSCILTSKSTSKLSLSVPTDSSRLPPKSSCMRVSFSKR